MGRSLFVKSVTIKSRRKARTFHVLRVSLESAVTGSYIHAHRVDPRCEAASRCVTGITDHKGKLRMHGTTHPNAV
jgi:hypothetical protein